MTFERSSPSLWNVTTPALSLPSVLRQATRSSGSCSVISASHSWRLPPNSATQWRCLSSSLADLLDALHERRELLELGPLVVGRLDRDVDLDALLDGGHAASLVAPLEAHRGRGPQPRPGARPTARASAGAPGPSPSPPASRRAPPRRRCGRGTPRTRSGRPGRRARAAAGARATAPRAPGLARAPRPRCAGWRSGPSASRRPATSRARAGAPRGRGSRPGRDSGGGGRPRRPGARSAPRAAGRRRGRRCGRRSRSRRARGRRRRAARSRPRSGPARRRCPPAAPPTCSTTTASGPRPIPSIISAWTSSSSTASRWTRASSEFRTVYWPGWVLEPDAELARAGADRRELAPRSAPAVAELRQVRVARVGRERGRHPVHADVLRVEVGEDRRRAGRARPRGPAPTGGGACRATAARRRRAP